jgi:hypothetical protein
MEKRDFYETKMRIRDRSELDAVTAYLIGLGCNWRYEKSEKDKNEATWLAVYKGGGMILGKLEASFRKNPNMEIQVDDFLGQSLAAPAPRQTELTPDIEDQLNLLDSLL